MLTKDVVEPVNGVVRGGVLYFGCLACGKVTGIGLPRGACPGRAIITVTKCTCSRPVKVTIRGIFEYRWGD